MVVSGKQASHSSNSPTATQSRDQCSTPSSLSPLLFLLFFLAFFFLFPYLLQLGEIAGQRINEGVIFHYYLPLEYLCLPIDCFRWLITSSKFDIGST